MWSVKPMVRSVILAAGVAVSLAMIAPAALAQPVDRPGAGQGRDEGPPLRLETTTFNPSRGEAPDIPPGLAIRGYAQGQRGYYIVQFEGPVEPQWRQALEAAGAQRCSATCPSSPSRCA